MKKAIALLLALAAALGLCSCFLRCYGTSETQQAAQASDAPALHYVSFANPGPSLNYVTQTPTHTVAPPPAEPEPVKTPKVTPKPAPEPKPNTNPALPDLEVTVRCDESSFYAGGHYYFYVTVKNIGDAPMENGCDIKFGISINGELDTVDFMALYGTINPNEINEKPLCEWSPTGQCTYKIHCTVDNSMSIKESNENNNETTFTAEALYVPPPKPPPPPPVQKPDLVAKAITYDKNNLGVGRRIFFDSSVANIGNADTGGFNIKWFVNGTEMGYGRHEGVKAGTTVANGNSQFYWTPQQSGMYMVTFYVDCDEYYDEFNELNNNSNVTVTIP